MLIATWIANFFIFSLAVLFTSLGVFVFSVVGVTLMEDLKQRFKDGK